MNLDPEDEQVSTNIASTTSAQPSNHLYTSHNPENTRPNSELESDSVESQVGSFLEEGVPDGVPSSMNKQFNTTSEAQALPSEQNNIPRQKINATASRDAQMEPRNGQLHLTLEGYPYSPWTATVADTPPFETDEKQEPSNWAVAKAVIREIVETVVLTLIIFFLIQLVIRNFRVDGHSMDPNLYHGQYLVVDKISYSLPGAWRTPTRGDVVVFEPPTHPDKDFVKRIIGLPGETIEIRQGQIFIDSVLFEEPYGAFIGRYTLPPQVVPAGHFFVMGDNRPNSNDSRNWGPLEEEKIVGKVWLSYWPPKTWGIIPNDGPTETGTLSNAIQSFLQ